MPANRVSPAFGLDVRRVSSRFGSLRRGALVAERSHGWRRQNSLTRTGHTLTHAEFSLRRVQRWGAGHARELAETSDAALDRFFDTISRRVSNTHDTHGTRANTRKHTHNRSKSRYATVHSCGAIFLQFFLLYALFQTLLSRLLGSITQVAGSRGIHSENLARSASVRFRIRSVLFEFSELGSRGNGSSPPLLVPLSRGSKVSAGEGHVVDRDR